MINSFEEVESSRLPEHASKSQHYLKTIKEINDQAYENQQSFQKCLYEAHLAYLKSVEASFAAIGGFLGQVGPEAISETPVETDGEKRQGASAYSPSDLDDMFQPPFEETTLPEAEKKNF